MNTQEAKQIIKTTLHDLNLPDYKLTAKTIDFTNLARDSQIFVKIHNWQPSPLWANLKEMASKNGFCIED